MTFVPTYLIAAAGSQARLRGDAAATRESYIAENLVENPAFTRGVLEASRRIAAKVLPIENCVSDSNITPTVRTGLLYLFKQAAEGMEAENIKAQSRALLTQLLPYSEAQILDSQNLHAIALIAARDHTPFRYPGSMSSAIEIQNAKKYIETLTDDDYARLGARAAIDRYHRRMRGTAVNSDCTRDAFADAGVATGGSMADRFLFNTVRQYATALEKQLSVLVDEQTSKLKNNEIKR